MTRASLPCCLLQSVGVPDRRDGRATQAFGRIDAAERSYQT